jgi:hypothetical protein
MYSINREKVTTASSSVLSERMPKMNQHCEEEGPFVRYSNIYIYMYNYGEYSYILLKHVYHD